jgi:hypothetical protein
MERAKMKAKLDAYERQIERSAGQFQPVSKKKARRIEGILQRAKCRAISALETSSFRKVLILNYIPSAQTLCQLNYLRASPFSMIILN